MIANPTLEQIHTEGFFVIRGYLSPEEQEMMLGECREICKNPTPLYHPTMQKGVEFRLRNTNCGEWGWVALNGRYSYERTHPLTGAKWRDMPLWWIDTAKELAFKVGAFDFKPQNALINYYTQSDSLGLHQDKTEKNRTAPIISFSLGDSGYFEIGGLGSKSPTKKVLLKSGDVAIMSGTARNAFHSFVGTLPGTSTLVKNGGRVNVTIRQVY